MKVNIKILIAIALIGVMAWVILAGRITTTSTPKTFNLTVQEIAFLKQAALNHRDSTAARRLGDYYSFTNGNPKMALFWYDIAAKAGDNATKAYLESLRKLPGYGNEEFVSPQK